MVFAICVVNWNGVQITDNKMEIMSKLEEKKNYRRYILKPYQPKLLSTVCKLLYGNTRTPFKKKEYSHEKFEC